MLRMPRTVLVIASVWLALVAPGCEKGAPVAKTDTEHAEPADHAGSPDEKESASEESGVLTVGDAAPPLDIETWVSGTAVDQFDPKKIYIVEFWATWCPPCRVSMPHLSELQQQHLDDVVIVGVSSEKEKEVTDFLASEREDGQTWKDVVKYAIAVDRENATSDAYMNAAHERGIPTAFVIGRDGRIDWIGHPMSLDPVLPRIAQGDWDRELARKERAELMAREEEVNAAMQAVMAARAKKDYPAAIAALNPLLEKYPEDLNLHARRFQLFLEGKQFDDAIAAMQAIDLSNSDQRDLLHFMASIATNYEEPALLEAALQAAQKLNDNSEEKDADILDTLARVYFSMGRLDDAISWQEQAVAIDGGDGRKERLDEYRKALEKKQAPEAAPDTDAAETAGSDTAKPDAAEADTAKADAADADTDGDEAAEPDSAGPDSAESDSAEPAPEENTPDEEAR